MSILKFTGVRMLEEHLAELSLPEIKKGRYLKTSELGYTSKPDLYLDTMEVDLNNLEAVNSIFHTHITSPHDFGGRARDGENWVRATCLMIDFDGVPVADGRALLDELDCDYVIKYSCGHMVRQVEKGDRWHAIIPLDRPITTKEDWKLAVGFAVSKFGEQQDASCKDLARNLFPGNRQYSVRTKVYFGALSTDRVLEMGKQYLSRTVKPVVRPKMAESTPRVTYNLGKTKAPFKLKLDTVLETAKYGSVTVREAIQFGDANIECGCPVCFRSSERSSPGEFNAHLFIPDNNKDEMWSLQCSSCTSRGRSGFYNLDLVEISKEVQRENNCFFFYNKRCGELRVMQKMASGAYEITKTTTAFAKNEHKRWGIPYQEVFASYEPKLVFGSDERFLDDIGVINMYDAPEILRTAADESAVIPDSIANVLKWNLGVVNNDGWIKDPDAEATYEWFLDWMACIVQTRSKMKTTWVLQGTQGTGKGGFYKYIIRPIFGAAFSSSMPQEALKSNFNSTILEQVFVVIDEAQMEVKNKFSNGRLQALIKMLVTEDSMSSESKGVDRTTVENFVNFLFFTNQHDSVEVESGDRRFNVGYRQIVPIHESWFVGGMNMQEWWDTQIDAEKLATFVAALKARKYNSRVKYLPIETAPKQSLKEESMSVTVHFWKAVQEKDRNKLAELLDGGDTSLLYDADAVGTNLLRRVEEFLDQGMILASVAGDVMKYLNSIPMNVTRRMHKSEVREALDHRFRLDRQRCGHRGTQVVYIYTP